MGSRVLEFRSMHSDRRHIEPLLLVGLFAIGAVGVLGYSWATRVDSAHPDSRSEVRAPSSARQVVANAQSPRDEQAYRADQGDEPSPPSTAARAEPAPAPLTVEELIVNTTSGDPNQRAAAITALGSAPRDEALPALESILNTADNESRTLALQALRTLALGQGDEDGRIRDAIRKLVYHGSDEDMAAGAAAALDKIESDIN